MNKKNSVLSIHWSLPFVMAFGDDNAGTAATIEDFESKSLALYKCPKGENNFTIKSTAAHDGANGLIGSGSPQSGEPLGGKWIYRDDAAALTKQGDRLSVWTKRSNVNPGPTPTPDVAGGTNIGFGCSAERCYFVAVTCQTTHQTCEFRVSKVLDLSNAPATSIALNAVPQTYIAHRWYKVIVEWNVGGLIVAYLYDSDGSTLLNTVSATDNTWTSGGIGLRGFGPGDYYFDTYDRYVQP